ncbi:MAG: ABC transporter ATP-binding protein [Lachnospiraceae bacterium]|nr:ABC transporter ATP-binding protein [Lachnospiraceae bacterium]
MGEYSIITKGLTKKYGNKRALRNIDIKLHKDEIIGLVGANGSGKTTFFNICSGIDSPTEGEITVFGKNPRKDVDVAEKIVYTNANLPVGEMNRIIDVLDYYNIMYDNFDMDFAMKLVRMFDLSEFAKIKSLSTGMRSVTHFICGIAARCDITIFDEPINGVDVGKRKLINKIIMGDFIEHPRTIFITTHILSEIDNIVSEIMLINEGALVFYKSIDEVREMFFRADGEKAQIDKVFTKEDCCFRQDGEISSFVIGCGSPNGELASKAMKEGIKVSAITPEEACYYSVNSGNNKEVESLWD